MVLFYILVPLIFLNFFIGYNNPIWLRKKIETQQKQMKYFENKNLDLRCKIIDMKVTLGFKGKNIRRSDCVKAVRFYLINKKNKLECNWLILNNY